jgi:hypothetical protein
LRERERRLLERDVVVIQRGRHTDREANAGDVVARIQLRIANHEVARFGRAVAART